jgi:hypothetical protein
LAELVALQLHFLPSGVVVTNLLESEVADFICKHPKCLEAVIVAEAYGHHRSWATAVFNHVILRGDWNYFREFQSYSELSSSELRDIVAKFMQSKAKRMGSDKDGGRNAPMQRLLSQCQDLSLQFELNRKMGAVDAAMSLMQGENGAFLRDLQEKSQL